MIDNLNVESNVKLKFDTSSYFSNIMKLLNLTTARNKVTPVLSEIYDMEKKFSESKSPFLDEDEVSTVALSSNPSSFSSNESAEEYFSTKESPFIPEEFNDISILGSGSFGIVILSEYKNKTYAIKKLLKRKINADSMSQIMMEKQLLMQMNDPFIIKFCGTFQTHNELCFVTEAIECGDLYNAIYYGEKITHDACVFYTAGIILGLDFIHSKNIAFRDLKPENVMIGENGYPKIIDFGLAKQLPYSKMDEFGMVRNYSKCHSLCGTPEYLAPEIILGKGYDKYVDIWSLGVMMYEMIFKRTPFVEDKKCDDHISKTFTNIILAGKNGILISNKIDKKTDGTDAARNLITQLLNGNIQERVGGHTAILLDHAYFKSRSININDLYEQIIPAPILQPQYMGSDLDTLKDVEEYNGDQTLFDDF